MPRHATPDNTNKYIIWYVWHGIFYKFNFLLKVMAFLMMNHSQKIVFSCYPIFIYTYKRIFVNTAFDVFKKNV